MDNEMQPPPASDRATSPRIDLVGLATLIGVIVMMTITGVNLRQVSRLTDRVVKMETAMNSARRSGPDPNQVYTVQTTGAPTKGPDNAPVTIVVFSEFQCPFCARFAPTLKQIEDTYQGSVRVVFKHLPLPIHKDAVGAALAAEAARKQGKFWEYHDKLFADQKRLGPDDLKQHAKDLQLDLKRFEADMRDPQDEKRIKDDVAEAGTLGIAGTPGTFINGRFLAGAQPFASFAKLIDEELTKRNLPIPSSPAAN